MKHLIAAGAMLISLAACAGAPPNPVSVIQPQDAVTDCPAIFAQIDANNHKLTDLASAQGAKVAQNVTAGVLGLFIWPIWFATDFQGSAGIEITALQDRQHYLATLATQRHCAAA
jgi:hypothetical protein